MKRILFLCLAWQTFLFSQVDQVNDANFNHALKSNAILIVKFFQPRCGSCQDLQPIFEAASEQLLNCKFVEINSFLNPKTRQIYQVKTVPVIIFFENGKELFRLKIVNSVKKLVELIKQHCYKYLR
jgi:thioredoxin 1